MSGGPRRRARNRGGKYGWHRHEDLTLGRLYATNSNLTLACECGMSVSAHSFYIVWTWSRTRPTTADPQSHDYPSWRRSAHCPISDDRK